MTIAKAALKVIPPTRKWNVELSVAGIKRSVTVSAREWAEVVAVLDVIIGTPWELVGE